MTIFRLIVFLAVTVSMFLFGCASEKEETSTKTTNSNTPDLISYQWHLKNTGQKAFASTAGVSGQDINQETTYNSGNYGLGIIVAVVDEGLEIAHEDLVDNIVSGGSWDFVWGDNNPTRSATDGDHGTSVSGLIAARDNGLGGRGVAPEASLKGFNFLDNQGTTNWVASIGGSSNNPKSDDVDVFNMSFGMSNTYDTTVNTTVEAQYKSGTETLRGNKGAIYVKSAGNGYKKMTTSGSECNSANAILITCQNGNMDPYATLPYIFVVGALDASGERSSYSTTGSNLLISAPGGEYGYDATYWSSSDPNVFEPAMITTDQSGCGSGYSRTNTSGKNEFEDNRNDLNPECSYTSAFNGTSSAAPVLSGAAALMLKENSSLTWRDVKHILISTARVYPVTTDHGRVTVTLSDTTTDAEQTWLTNNAGYKFHNWYGFGQLDIDAAVTMANGYSSGWGAFNDSDWISGGAITDAVIENNATTGASDTTTVASSSFIEAVQIRVNVTHTYTGDLGIILTNVTTGTSSILLNIRSGFSSDTNLTNMILLSNAFYGEDSSSDWIIRVIDGGTGTSSNGTLVSWDIRIFGH